MRAVILRAAAVAALCATGCSWEWDRYVPGPLPDASVADVSDLGDPDVADVTGMDAPDVAMTVCNNDEECSLASTERPVCDSASGRCVACTATRDVCGAGRYCAPDQTCATGCRDDESCRGMGGDGGADGGVTPSRCDPATHACVQCLGDDHCPVGMRCLDRVCATSGCDALHPCAGGLTCCGGACVDTSSDPSHCGVCGSLCSTVNGAPACTASRCGVGRCNEPFADCDADATTGCETNTQSSVAHCGGCGRACAARPNAVASCAAGACAYACAPGFGDCDGDASNGCEVDLARTLTNCGRCGNACDFMGGSGVCAGGVCTRTSCAAGRGDCDADASNGCEVDLRTDPAHCLMCGTSCRFNQATAACVSGACAIASCNAGYDNCDGDAANGCEAPLATSLSHCGMCGRACTFAHATATCTAGTCAMGACSTGFANCDASAANGCEVDVTASTTHCGRCGSPCPARANATTTCTSGSCGYTCQAGFGDCDGSAANGCETNTATSLTACGMCGRACTAANGTVACVAGACTITACTGNLADCDRNPANGCEVDPIADNRNCGACGVVCAAGRSCVAGRCAVATFNGYDVTTSPAGLGWIEACAVPGSLRLLAGADDELIGGDVPFAVEFWGSTNRTFFVSSNGWVGFGNFYGNINAIPNMLPYGHFGALPRSTAPYPAAYVLGVDLVQGGEGVCVATVGTAPNRVFVIETLGAQLYASTRGAGPSQFSFELVAYESSTNLDMVYNGPFSGPLGASDMNAPNNVTVGLQDFRTTPRAATYTGVVTAATRLRFTPR